MGQGGQGYTGQMDDETRLKFYRQFNTCKIKNNAQVKFTGFGNAKFSILINLYDLVENEEDLDLREQNELIAYVYTSLGFITSEYVRNNVSDTWGYEDEFVEFLNGVATQVSMLAWRVAEFFNHWYTVGNPGFDSPLYTNIAATLSKMDRLDINHLGMEVDALERKLGTEFPPT